MATGGWRNPALMKVDNVIVKLTKYVGYAAVPSVLISLAVAFVDVLSAKIFRSSIPYSAEMIQYMNVPTVFLVVAYVQLTSGHVTIEALYQRFPPVIKRILGLIINIASAAISWFVAYRSLVYMLDRMALNVKSAITYGFVIWPFIGVLSLGYFLLGLAFLWSGIRTAAGVGREETRGPAPDADAKEVE